MPSGVEITSTTHAAFLPELWASDTQKAMEFKQVLAALVDTRFEREIKTMGRILSIQRYSNIAVQSKVEGLANEIQFNAVQQDRQRITIDTYQYVAVLLNAVVQAQSKYNDRAALTDKMAYALVRGMEVNIANVAQTFTQTVGAYGSDATDADLRKAWQFLADAGFYDNASWVFSPGMAQSIFGIDRFVSKDFQDDTPAVQTAKLPTMYNHPAYVSNLLRSPSAGAHDNMLIHKSAIILLRQVAPSFKEQYRIEWNADALLAYQLYAVAKAQIPKETPIDNNGSSPGTELVGDQAGVLIKGL